MLFGRREQERVQDFFLRSSKFRRSEFVGLITKFHRLEKGYTCVQKKGGVSPKIQRRRFGEINVSEFKRYSQDLIPFYYASRGRFFLTWVLLPPFWLI